MSKKLSVTLTSLSIKDRTKVWQNLLVQNLENRENKVEVKKFSFSGEGELYYEWQVRKLSFWEEGLPYQGGNFLGLVYKNGFL